MLYVNTVREDERQHERFCQAVRLGVPFPGWKQER
jgi:hypothetical protein